MSLQKILLFAAVAGALSVIVRKALAYERASADERIPTVNPVQDADPQRPEPLNSSDLPVAQNAPF